MFRMGLSVHGNARHTKRVGIYYIQPPNLATLSFSSLFSLLFALIQHLYHTVSLLLSTLQVGCHIIIDSLIIYALVVLEVKLVLPVTTVSSTLAEA